LPNQVADLLAFRKDLAAIAAMLEGVPTGKNSERISCAEVGAINNARRKSSICSSIAISRARHRALPVA
jgi:hypothetical protein